MIALMNGETKNDIAQLSAAEKLIRLFENMNDVSFVYVKHKINSGFVSYTKDRNQSTNIQAFSDTENNCLAHEIEIDSWRKSLGLNENREILVAFAWAHDLELRMLQMFPEFVAIDGTFGVNRQRRSLLTATGKDSENKSFIGFRCFMPSKQKRAYSWAIGKAMLFLVGESMQYNQVLTCDMEQALVDSILEAINNPTSHLRNSKLRLDYYHLFEHKWSEYVSIYYNIWVVIGSVTSQYPYIA